MGKKRYTHIVSSYPTGRLAILMVSLFMWASPFVCCAFPLPLLSKLFVCAALSAYAGTDDFCFWRFTHIIYMYMYSYYVYYA